jgi:uncharacterized damage-inducible protein DinB
MTKELLINQFSRCYDENGWFVAVRNAIEGLTAEQAAWRPAGTDNTIRGSLAHLTYYNNAYLQRFKGIEFQYDTTDNDETFQQAAAASDQDWQEEVDRFDSVMHEFRELIRAADNVKFSEPVPTNTSRKWWEVIADMNAHNAYHAGQILLLRKLQGAWKPEKGVS